MDNFLGRALLLVGLFSGLLVSCTDRARGECPIGEVGCDCKPGGSCDAELVCDPDGFCTDPNCPVGNLDCSCSADGVCDEGLECEIGTGGDACDSGSTCEPGVCRTLDCNVGTKWCVCGSGGECGFELLCQEGLCKPDPCPVGSEGCPCMPGGCDPGLTCMNGICGD